MTTRDEVLREFEEPVSWVQHHRMADEIVRLRDERDAEIARVVRLTERLGAEMLRADRAERILAALREPSETVTDAFRAAYVQCEQENEWIFTHHMGIAEALRAAVAAAEREVQP